jgi:hypothetical protein
MAEKPYMVPYTRTEWGMAVVTAESLDAARKGEFSVLEEYDNKSEYDFENKKAKAAKKSPRGGWE